jgi:hypothetical protein
MAMQSSRLFVAAVVGLCLVGGGAGAGGCAQQKDKGVAFSKLDSLQIVKGQTTEQEVINALGAPAKSVNCEGGDKILTWYGTQARYQSGPFGVGYDRKVDNRTLTVTTRNGVVVDFNEHRTQQT